MTILLVDDEPEYLVLLKDCLVRQGMAVHTAPNGLVALDLMEDNPVDMVVSDIYMPVMDGLKFHKRVRTHPRFSGIPFLFVSSYDDDYSKMAIKGSAIDGFMRKAKPVSELLAWVKYLTTPAEERNGMQPPQTLPPPDQGGPRRSRTRRR